ncbi:MAG: DAK2 domain-containing protein [Lachnospiraceae bacterium]|nr:DAK2 domain-containing protein [Lachnospiraceae bacterium]
MAIVSINAEELKKLFLAGAGRLESKKEWINELNVFPVPDGDTGTNMTMTILSAAREVQALPEVTMAGLAKAISSGSLRGARGNSGVILSQLFRGFTKEIKDKDVLNANHLAAAFLRASETAYKAVMKPKEGTILTVAKGMADKAAELAGSGIGLEDFMREVIAHGDSVLSRTPEMLPVLKQAGVVDSGGQGLMMIMKGAYEALLGKEIDVPAQAAAPLPAPMPEAAGSGTGAAFDGGEIRFGYCTEFIINLEKELPEEQVSELKGYLESIGDSLVVVADEDLVKVHVHTNDPGLAIQKALTYGSLSRMKIDNMREEHEERLFAASQTSVEKGAQAISAAVVSAPRPASDEAEAREEIPSFKEFLAGKEAATEKERKPFGFIAVSVGEGMNEIFRGLNVDEIIEGGQTMNPSTEDMLNAIERVNADTVYIFPNNKNIILAAEQAMHLTEDKEIVVVPTKTVPQGITAIINFSPESAPEENRTRMEEEMKKVKTGQLTYAIRNTNLDDYEIHEGDIMGIGDHSIVAVGTDIHRTAVEMIEALTDDDSELISIYYGAEVKEAEAEALREEISEEFSGDVEVYNGGQPIYYYVVSVE